jgi:hypothetical protein
MQALKQHWRRAPLAIATMALLSACGNKDAQPASNPPAREIQLAPTTSAPPQLNDAPLKQAPAPAPTPRKRPQAPPRAVPTPVPTKANAPAPPEPQVVVTSINPAPASPAGPAPTPTGTIDAGRTLTVHPASRVCTTAQKVGDHISATLSESVQGSNGATIPAGSTVMLRVVESARSQNSKDSVKLAFAVVSVRVGDETYDVDGRVTTTTPLERVRAQSTGDQAKKVGTGAVIGAIAGQILGRNTRSTVIGGAVGAAAGGAVAAGTADYDGCVPTTGVLTITLNHPLKIKVAAD